MSRAERLKPISRIVNSLRLEDRRIEAARRIATHIGQHLKADLSLQLWTGEVLPLGPGARDDIRIVLTHPGAVRRLILRPSLMTLFELFGAGDVLIKGGSPLEAAQRWDHGRAVHLPRRVDKGLIARELIPFLTGGKALGVGDAAYDLEGMAGQRQDKAARRDKDFISFHYDVGNDFYSLFLDPEMVYSSACFADDGTSLEEAQTRKLDLICRKLRLKPGQKLLDVGCGWGGLSCWAARNYGVTVHGVTLSEEQLAFALAKVERLGLSDQITLELRDYRDLDMSEHFDAISQVEMFEHVGFANHERHFLEMKRLLKPGGLYFHQASVRRGSKDARNLAPQTHATRAISRFIFPGGELDTIGMTVTNLGRLGFEVLDVENLREHFQRTTAEWSRRLMARHEEAAALVGEERTRLWLIFFAMCAQGFERGSILVYQTVAQRRRAGPSGLPLDRSSLYT